MAAAHFRYKKDSLNWTPTGGSAIPIVGVQSIRGGEGGDVVDLMSDASEVVQEQPLGNIKGRITVQTLHQLHAGIALGGGALAWVMEQVRSGRGVTGVEYDVEFANAVLVDKDFGVGSAAGEGTTLQFQAADNGADAGDTVTIAVVP